MASVRKESVQIDVEIAGKKAGSTLKELQGTAKQLRNEISNLTPGTDAFIKKAEELRKVNAQIKSINDEIKGISTELGKGGTAFGQFFQKVKDGAGKAGAVFQKAFFIIEVIKQVYEAIRAFVDLGTESVKTRNELEKLGVSGEQNLERITAKAQVVARSFDVEIKEVLKTTNVLAKTFGQDFGSTLDFVQTKMIEASDLGGEFLEVLSEYAPQAKAAGMEMDDFANMLIYTERQGAYSIDKVADSMKEFGLRTREQTKATSDSLAVLGTDFRDKLFKGINDGSISSSEAFKMIINRMNELKLPTNQVQTIIADTFGSPGEDLSLPFLTQLAEVKDGYAGLSPEARKYAEVQKELMQAQEEIFIKIGEFADGVKKFFFDLWDSSQPLKEAFSEIWQQIKNTFDEVSNLFRAFGVMQKEGSGAKLVIDILTVAVKAAFLPFKVVLATIQAISKALQDLRPIAAGVANVFSSLSNLANPAKAFSEGYAKEAGRLAELQKQDALKNLKEQRDAFLSAEADKLKAAKSTTTEVSKQRGFATQAELDAQAKKNAKLLEEEKKQKERLDKIKSAIPEKLEINTGGQINNPLSSGPNLAGRKVITNTTIGVGEAQDQFNQAKSGFSLSTLKDKKNQLTGSLDAEKADKIAQLKGDKQKELEIEKEYNAKKLQAEKDFQSAKYNVQLAGLATAKDILGGVMELMSEESKGRKALGMAMKAATIAEIIIKTQAEIAGYMAHPGSIASLGVVGGIKAGIAVARAAVGIAKVAQQKFAGGGMVRGNSHANGGVPIEAEGGEFIFRKQVVTPDTLPIFRRINQYGLKKYADGGLVSLTPNVPMSAVGNRNNNNASGQNDRLLKVMEMAIEAYSKPINVSVEANVNPRKVVDWAQMQDQAKNKYKL